MSKRKYNKCQIEEAVKKSQCIADVFRGLGISINGGSYNWMKGVIQREGIDTSHFLSGKELFQRNRFVKKTEDLSKQDQIHSSQRVKAIKLRKFMLAHNIKYQCNNTDCGISTWNGLPLILDIDHKDENCLNNHIDNLQFLCPNCHRQKTI